MTVREDMFCGPLIDSLADDRADAIKQHKA